MNHEYLKFSNFNAGLQDLVSNDMGEIMLTIEFKPLTKKRLSIEDFDLLKLLGRGSFGKVMQVVKKDTKQIYALKIIRKQHIVSRLEVTHTLAERTVLARINNPFIVPLKFSFQSPKNYIWYCLSSMVVNCSGTCNVKVSSRWTDHGSILQNY